MVRWSKWNAKFTSSSLTDHLISTSIFILIFTLFMTLVIDYNIYYIKCQESKIID